MIFSFEEKDKGQKDEETGDHICSARNPHHRVNVNGMGGKKNSGEKRQKLPFEKEEDQKIQKYSI